MVANSQKPTYEELLAMVEKQRQQLQENQKTIEENKKVIEGHLTEIERLRAFKKVAGEAVLALTQHCEKTLTGDAQIDRRTVEELTKEAKRLHSIVIEAQAFRSHFAAGGESVKSVVNAVKSKTQPTNSLGDMVEDVKQTALRLERRTTRLQETFEQTVAELAQAEGASELLKAHNAIAKTEAPVGEASSDVTTNETSTEAAQPKKTLGRQCQSVEPDMTCEQGVKENYCCTDCSKTMRHCNDLVNEFVDITKRTSEAAYRIKTLAHAYYCHHCKKIEFDIPSNMPVPVTPLRGVSMSSIIETIWLAYNGIPVHRVRGIYFEDFKMGHTVIPDAVSALIKGYLAGVSNAIRDKLAQCRVVISDETSYRVLAAEGIGPSKDKETDPKKQRSKNYVLAMTAGQHCPIPLTYYANIKGRKTDDIEVVLSEMTEMEVLTSDGYQAYEAIAKKSAASNKKIKHATCNVHFRRTVIKGCDLKALAMKTEKAIDEQGLRDSVRKNLMSPSSSMHLLGVVEAYQKIYAYEASIKQEEGESKEQLLARIKACRHEHERPLMDKIDTIMTELAKEHVKPGTNGKNYVTKSNLPVADAVVYYLNKKEELRAFLEDPEIPLDSNAIERKIRRLVVLRNNNLFEQTAKGLDELCMLFTVIETARDNGIKDVTQWLYQMCRAGYVHCLNTRYTKAYREGIVTSATQQIQKWDIAELMKSFDLEPWLPWNYAKNAPSA